MANQAIEIRGKGRVLFQAGHKELSEYRKMPIGELQTLIERIERGDKPKTAKASANGNKTAHKSTVPVAKSNARKTPAKGAAQGKTERPAAAAVSPKRKGSIKDRQTERTSVKGTSAKQVVAKENETPTIKRDPKAARGSIVGRVTRDPKANEASFRSPVDRKKVNWKAPWNGAVRGSRKIVMDALRTHKGDTEAVVEELKDQAATIFNVKGDPVKYLRWRVNRTAYDFAMATGQHDPGVRVAPGKRVTKAGAPRPRKGANPMPRKSAAQKGAVRVTGASQKGKAIKPANSGRRSIHDR